MDNIEFAKRLAQVQDELGNLHSYLERNSVIGEREDYLLLGLIRAAFNVSLCFSESIATLRDCANQKALQIGGPLLFQSAHAQHVQPHFTCCIRIEIAITMAISPNGELDKRAVALDKHRIR